MAGCAVQAVEVVGDKEHAAGIEDTKDEDEEDVDGRKEARCVLVHKTSTDILGPITSPPPDIYIIIFGKPKPVASTCLGRAKSSMVPNENFMEL